MGVGDERRHDRLGAVVVEHLADTEQERGDQQHDVEQRIRAHDLVDGIGRGQEVASHEDGNGDGGSEHEPHRGWHRPSTTAGRSGR